jgi:hypothetical protein
MAGETDRMQPSMAVSTGRHQPIRNAASQSRMPARKSSLAVLSSDWKEEEPRCVVSGGAFLIEYPSAARICLIDRTFALRASV